VNVSINIIVTIAGICLIDLCYIFVATSYLNFTHLCDDACNHSRFFHP
jgi:hypothetical protein